MAAHHLFARRMPDTLIGFLYLYRILTGFGKFHDQPLKLQRTHAEYSGHSIHLLQYEGERTTSPPPPKKRRGGSHKCYILIEVWPPQFSAFGHYLYFVLMEAFATERLEFEAKRGSYFFKIKLLVVGIKAKSKSSSGDFFSILTDVDDDDDDDGNDDRNVFVSRKSFFFPRR